MSDIQTTHRRVVLVHCDWIATKRVINTAKELELFDGNKIWILLDGLLDAEVSFNSDAFLRSGNFPNGMLVLRNIHQYRNLNVLDSVVELIGKAAISVNLDSLVDRVVRSSAHSFVHDDQPLADNRTSTTTRVHSRRPTRTSSRSHGNPSSQPNSAKPLATNDNLVYSSLKSSASVLAARPQPQLNAFNSHSSFSSPKSPSSLLAFPLGTDQGTAPPPSSSNSACVLHNSTDAQQTYRRTVLRLVACLARA